MLDCGWKKWGGGFDLTVGRAGLALAVVTVVVGRDQRSVDVNAVRDSLAEAVSCENHSD